MLGKKILVIDDEPDVVLYLSTFLEDEGYEVVTAGDGPRGLEQARAERPHLITLDVTMPGMSGVEVFSALRRDPDLEHIPVVMITGVERFLRLAEYKELRPPDAFIPKPMDMDGLMDVIAGILGEPAS